jgi:hypothetical protein
VVTLGIEVAGYLQNTAWAIRHAQLAALAAFNNQMDLALWHDDTILVKRFTPKSHGCPLLTGG